MHQMTQLTQQFSKIEEKLGYTFQDRSLLMLAFIHRSFLNENRTFLNHNERLEFLGDAILGLLTSDYLYHHFPNTPEGELSYLRSRLVEAASCVDYINTLELSSFVCLGKGEKMNNGRGRESILADLFEAIIGAIYLDGGLIAAKNFFFNQLKNNIEQILDTPLKNWKALLQDHCQKIFQETPSYQVICESGPDHSKIFEIVVSISHKELGTGTGSSKKEAQQAAAANAIQKLMNENQFSNDSTQT